MMLQGPWVKPQGQGAHVYSNSGDRTLLHENVIRAAKGLPIAPDVAPSQDPVAQPPGDEESAPGVSTRATGRVPRGMMLQPGPALAARVESHDGQAPTGDGALRRLRRKTARGGKGSMVLQGPGHTLGCRGRTAVH
jgi:hypothetical protein